MSEETMIDGVNVSGCIYYQDGKFADCGMFHLGDFKCKGQICLYKQLQCLKQENEKLNVALEKSEQVKKLIAFDRNGNAYFVSENNKYKQALEEIKGHLKSVSNVAPASTRKLKYAIEDIIKEVLNE